MGKNVSNINSWNWSNQYSIKHVLSTLKHPIYSNHAQIQNTQILSPKHSCLNLGSWCHCWFYSRSQDHQTSMNNKCEYIKGDSGILTSIGCDDLKKNKMIIPFQSGTNSSAVHCSLFSVLVHEFEPRTCVKRFPARGWVSLTPSYTS